MKQVIVIRKDLKMTAGKMAVQAAHASLNALLTTAQITEDCISLQNDPELKSWITGDFTKICVGVDTEAELLSLYNKAKYAGLRVALIKDLGLTQFHGIATYTTLAIGPHSSEKFIGFTDKLKLIH